MEPPAYQFAVSATFTADPIRKPLIFWSLALHSHFVVEFSPYNQVVQTLLDPNGLMARNRQGINVVLFRLEDLGLPERRRENLNQLLLALASAAPRLPMPLLLVPCPGLDAVDGLEDFLSQVESIANLHLLRPEWIDGLYPVGQKLSPAAEKLGQIPYTEEYFTALGTAIVRAGQSLRQTPVKVLALDCDQTLWRGVCGEDGPEGVKLSAGHAAVQEFALAQREKGILLALLSKNNLADVEETFACHPEFPLRWEHVSAHRINWQPKSQGLFSLAAELSLGIDSFVFLDDNSKEIAEVAEQAPQVLGLELPESPEDFAAFLAHTWCFDRLKVTREDRERAASYAQIAQFGRALEQTQSLEDFYQSLELQVEIRPLSGEETARAAQLTQRTNQFNLSTVRRNEGEIRQLATGSVFGIHVQDRFGDYGFTGLLVLDHLPGRLRVDTLLLSCRVLGRGVEHRVVSWIGHHAASTGCPTVEILFRETARNTPAKEFLRAAGIGPEMAAEDLMSLRFSPGEVQLPPQNTPAAVAASGEARPVIDYAYMAKHLRSVSQIQQAMAAQGRQASVGPARQIDNAPSTPSEEQLAAIWSDLLHRDDIAATDNFFDIGGHSLLVVLMIVKIREQFEVDLPIDEVYAADRNLAALAARIDELLHFGGVDSEEYHRIVAEVAALSDLEVESRLLAATGSYANPARR
jgi:FkbH-like protein